MNNVNRNISEKQPNEETIAVLKEVEQMKKYPFVGTSCTTAEQKIEFLLQENED